MIVTLKEGRAPIRIVSQSFASSCESRASKNSCSQVTNWHCALARRYRDRVTTSAIDFVRRTLTAAFAGSAHPRGSGLLHESLQLFDMLFLNSARRGMVTDAKRCGEGAASGEQGESGGAGALEKLTTAGQGCRQESAAYIDRKPNTLPFGMAFTRLKNSVSVISVGQLSRMLMRNSCSSGSGSLFTVIARS